VEIRQETFGEDIGQNGWVTADEYQQHLRWLQEAGLTLAHTLDVIDNSAVLSTRWYEARARRRDALIALEGDAEFEKTQRSLAVVHTLASERRRSRVAFVAQK
jgi:hypothetical protein